MTKDEMDRLLGKLSCMDCHAPLHRIEYDAGRCSACFDAAVKERLETNRLIEEARAASTLKLRTALARVKS